MVLPEFFDAIGGTQLFLFVGLVGLLSAVWVYLDAKRRGADNAALWGASVGFLFLFYALPGAAALVIYLLLRGRVGAEDGDGTRQPPDTGTHDRE